MNLLFSYENICAHRNADASYRNRNSVDLILRDTATYIEHSQFNFSFNSYLFVTVGVFVLSFRWLTKSAAVKPLFVFTITLSIVTDLIQWKQMPKNGKNTILMMKKKTHSLFLGKNENLYDY